MKIRLINEVLLSQSKNSIYTVMENGIIHEGLLSLSKNFIYTVRMG
jgi:hypothetical protein